MAIKPQWGRESRRIRREAARQMAKSLMSGSGSLSLWYESTLLWGCVGVVGAFVLTFVAAKMSDLRWLLIVAWPFACVAVWSLFRRIHPALLKWALILLGCMGCAGLLLRLNYRLSTPSFAFIVPGVWINDNTWDFIVNQRGPSEVYNADFTLTDRIKLDRLRHTKTSFTRNDIASYLAKIHIDEIDPKGRGNWDTRYLLWTPDIPEHEHYEITITSRNGIFFEDLRIERVVKEWTWAMTLKDAETGALLIKCRDRNFPEKGEPLPYCFPEFTKTNVN